MLIMFNKVRYKNFLSVGNMFIDIPLDRDKSTFVTGHNGSGKTTILESIVYALYGKPYRNVKLAGMINSTNKKGMVVEIEFTKGSTKYKVVRGEKPKKFEFWVDGEQTLTDASARDLQSKVEHVLGMDYRLFTQVVILNKAKFVPFLALSTSDRRKVVEDLLDISIFSRMAEITKKRLSEIKIELSDVRYEYDMKNKDLNSYKMLIANMKENKEEKNNAILSEIAEMETELTKKKEECVALVSQNDTLKEEQKSLLDDVKKLNECMTTGSKLVDNVASIDKRLKFLESGTCPTCKQDLCGEHLINEQKSLNDEKAELLNSMKEIRETATNLKPVELKNKEVSFNISEISGKISSISGAASTIINQIKTKKGQLTNPDSGDQKLLEAEEKLSEIESSIVEFKNGIDSTSKRLDALNLIANSLKDDGIKTRIIRNYLPLINLKINEYLKKFEFHIDISLDESFVEMFKSPNREGFVYWNLSDGQKSRVDLAILMAWLYVAESKSSVQTNVLFLDEILSAVDGEGVNLFMELTRDKLRNKNLFVIEQRQDMADNFDNSLRFALKNGFTEQVD